MAGYSSRIEAEDMINILWNKFQQNVDLLKDDRTNKYMSSAAIVGAGLLTTKGDLLSFDTSQTRIGVGADGGIIVADSAEAAGWKWAALASAGVMATSTYDPAGIGEQLAGLTTAQTLTNKTLTTPTIDDFANATHDHSNAVGGGTISHTALTSKGTNTHAQIDTHIANVTTNPHAVDKTDVGLGNVLNAEQVPAAEKGANNGVATLDAGGKIPAAQLPSTVMDFKGNWNASTNTPTLIDGTGSAGDVYLVSVAGTQNLGSGNQTFAVGDWIVYNGTIWEKSLNSNAVVSVNSEVGVVVLDQDDVAAGATYGRLTNTQVTDLTDSGDTTLHDHDGISENTAVRHTQGTDTALGSGAVAADHGAAATDQIINVSYGTSATPPTASTTTEGSLYIQYTA